MLVRLWWKEFRVFGPVWLTLVLAAVLFQWLMLSFRHDDVQGGALTFVALCWVVLYGFAIASAAFSGERESNTLGFLDALPVARRMLWMGKASFAFVSTAALALVLVGIAELGTTERSTSIAGYSWTGRASIFGPILIVGLACGLLWSALSKNTLLAATLTVLSVAVLMLPTADSRFYNDSALFPFLIFGIEATLALGTSLIALTWRPSSGWAVLSTRRARPARPITIRSASTGRSLFWQVFREGSSISLLVAVLALFGPLTIQIGSGRSDNIMEIFLVILAALIAGVSVFGSENSTGSRQFLVHHGVKASAVWSRRLLSWILVMGSILGITWFIFSNSPGSSRSQYFREFSGVEENLILLTSASCNGFFIAVLCGMAIRRRITAVLVASMACVALIVPQFILLSNEMIPVESLVLVPLILLAISAFWANDWLLEPEGFRRWLRLGLLTLVPFTLLGFGYIAYRGLGVAEVPPVFTSNPLEDSAVPIDQNAAPIYLQAIRLLQDKEEIRGDQILRENGLLWSIFEDSTNPLMFEDVKKNRPVIELARKASMLPRLQFEPLGRMKQILNDWEPDPDLIRLSLLIYQETRERQGSGDMVGAWDDIMIQFRLANQLVETTPTIASTRLAYLIHARAVGQAFDWLAYSRFIDELRARLNSGPEKNAEAIRPLFEPGKALEATRKALADLKALPRLPGLNKLLRVKSLLIERALDLPADELTAELFSTGGDPKQRSAAQFLISNWFITPPWERQRARWVCRQFLADDLAAATAEPWKRTASWRVTAGDLSSFRGSILARGLVMLPIPNLTETFDRETVNRRALDQMVALEVWKLEHDGKDATKLEELVPGLLPSLPIDPYSGKPFGYVQVDGAFQVGRLPENMSSIFNTNRPGTVLSLLYSVGPDKSDNLARKTYGFAIDPRSGDLQMGDLIFAIP